MRGAYLVNLALPHYRRLLLYLPRTLFALLEFTRTFCAFDFLLLIISMMDLNDKTWDCRSYTTLSRNAVDCQNGFSLFVTGGVILLVCEFVLLVLSIGVMQDERRERSQSRAVFSGGSHAQRIIVGQQVSVRNATSGRG